MTTQVAPKQALSGLRILDLARILTGPWATQILADLGAEAIKIEPPRSGDNTRKWCPSNVTDDAGNDRGAGYFRGANRRKKSVVIDIAHREGQQIDMALLDVQVATLANQAMNHLATGTSPKRLGSAHPGPGSARLACRAPDWRSRISSAPMVLPTVGTMPDT